MPCDVIQYIFADSYLSTDNSVIVADDKRELSDPMKSEIHVFRKFKSNANILKVNYYLLNLKLT